MNYADLPPVMVSIARKRPQASCSSVESGEHFGLATFSRWKAQMAMRLRLMKIAQDIRKDATEQGVSEEEAPKQGMEEKSKEFVERGQRFTRRLKTRRTL